MIIGYTQNLYTFTADLSFNISSLQFQQIQKEGAAIYAFAIMVPQLEDGCPAPDIDTITWPETSIELNGHQLIRVFGFL